MLFATFYKDNTGATWTTANRKLARLSMNI